MGSTQKLPSGKWSCRVYIGKKDGKNVYKRFTADTKREAERAAHAYLEQNNAIKSASGVTVKEAMEAYIAAKSKILSPSTVRGYDVIIRNRFQDIMNESVDTISKEEIQTSINAMAASVSPKSVKNSVALLTSAFSMFGREITKLSLPQKKKVEIVIPTDEELQLICEASKKWGIAFYVYLAAYMGMRRSEIAALDLKKDIDLKAMQIKINKAIVYDSNNEYVIKGTKTTNSTRILPIPEIVVPIIEEEIAKDKPLLTLNTIESRYVKMRKTIGMEHISFHALRHYFASALVVMDVPDFYAIKLMGHNSDRMLKNVYQHIRQEYMNEVSQKMDSFFTEKTKYDTDMTRST